MQNALNPQTFRDLNEHQGVIDKEHLRGRRLGDVQSQLEDVDIGLAEMNEAGRDKSIDNRVQMERSNPMRI